ncbi:MAG: hypothetical protein ACK502_08940 [Alphaproteobacteria bacterium]
MDRYTDEQKQVLDAILQPTVTKSDAVKRGRTSASRGNSLIT